MAAPARVRTSTRGHAEGPSLARLPLSPYPSELHLNSAPRPSPRKSTQSISPAWPAPIPQGFSRSPQRAETLFRALGFPGPRPAPLGPAPRLRGREVGPGARPSGWGRGLGGAKAPGGGPARAREMPVSAARAAAAAAAGEAAAGPRRGAAQGAGA